jgi:DNA-binding FrmR family transcriptional regulator
MLSNEHTRRDDIGVRLARVEGHVRGIKRMAEENKSCSDLLLQISAVQAALQRVAVIILEDHLEHCVLGTDPDQAHAALAEMREALSHFGR